LPSTSAASYPTGASGRRSSQANELHCRGIAGHLFLVPGAKGADVETREEAVHLGIGELRALEEPTDSMVATRRSAESRSGARLPNACQRPLNSSREAMSRRSAGVMVSEAR
jgi:hypothetical protein